MNLSFTLEITALFVFLISFVTTYILIPKLIGIVHYINLMDHPDERSSHNEKTATLGGVSFYISLIFGLFAVHYFEFDGSSLNVIVGTTILFLIGWSANAHSGPPYRSGRKSRAPRSIGK